MRRNKGMTLVEVLIAILITVIIGGSSVLFLRSNLDIERARQRLAIRKIEFLEDGKQQTVVVPPEQLSIALRYWQTEA